MTNEKTPERVWINSLPESGRVTAYVSPIREVGSGRSLSLAEYVRADLLATKVKEEREAERKLTLSIIQRVPATAAGADAFRKRVIEEMYRVAALTEKKEDRSEDEHHCYNKGGAL